jgi:hypothetical protein
MIAKIDIGLGIAAIIWLLTAIARIDEIAPDMVIFWGAATLLKNGANPYDMNLIQGLATTSVPKIGTLVGGFFVNPPHTLIFIRWLAEFNLQSATLLWKLFSTALILISLRIFCQRYENLFGKSGTVREGLWVGIYLGSFAPALVLMNIGQISALSLAGVCLYLAWRDGSLLERFAAGVAISLATVKPHIVLLPLMLITFDIIRARWHSLPIVISFIFFSLILPILLFASSFQQWSAAQNILPLTWFQPTLSGWLLATFGANLLVLRICPILFAALFMIWLTRRDRSQPELNNSIYPYLIALPLGLFTAPYAWLYDFVVALPTGMALLLFSMKRMAVKNNLLRLNVIILFVANICIMCGPEEMQYYVWYPPLITIQCWFIFRFLQSKSDYAP